MFIHLEGVEGTSLLTMQAEEVVLNKIWLRLSGFQERKGQDTGEKVPPGTGAQGCRVCTDQDLYYHSKKQPIWYPSEKQAVGLPSWNQTTEQSWSFALTRAGLACYYFESHLCCSCPVL